MAITQLERETESILTGLAEFLCNGSAVHPGALLTDTDEPVEQTVLRLAEQWTQRLNAKEEKPANA